MNINGGVFAQFNASAPSSDLINADYVIGFPLTFRKNDFSARLRLYHQSSHLGDEFLLGSPGLPRINLSFEEMEFLMSYEWRYFRVYGGVGYLVRREPELDRFRAQYGTELRWPIHRWFYERFVPYPLFWVMGGDFKQYQQHDYDLDYSLKAGFVLVNNLSDRRLKIFLNFYNGFNPFGQFYDQELTSFGFEINFGF